MEHWNLSLWRLVWSSSFNIHLLEYCQSTATLHYSTLPSNRDTKVTRHFSSQHVIAVQFSSQHVIQKLHAHRKSWWEPCPPRMPARSSLAIFLPSISGVASFLQRSSFLAYKNEVWQYPHCHPRLRCNIERDWIGSRNYQLGGQVEPAE